MRSLLDWTADPLAAPSPLPSLSARRRSGAWPVGLLPIRELAADLARRGLRYRRGSGFTILDESVDEYEAARMASVTLQIAAEQLAPAPPRSQVLLDHQERLGDELDRIQRDAHAAEDDYETAEVLADALGTGPVGILNGIRSALAAPDVLTLDNEQSGVPPADHADALARTARDIKASAAARSALLTALRAVLPAPTAPTRNETAAEAFLAAHDGAPFLRRPDLARLYAEAGSPGGLTPSELRSLAAARWGEPRPYQGHYRYTPARTRV